MTALASLTAGIKQGYKNKAKVCFVAGTLVMTAAGLMAIEQIKARDLREGDELCASSSIEKVTIEKILPEIAKEPVKVYNLQAEDFHTYHVGAFGVWVHNCTQEEGGAGNLKTDELIVRDIKFLDDEGNIDWEKWAPDGGRVPGTIQEGQTIEAGAIIDRYGNPYGKYTSPVGVPYEQRSLPYVENPNAYHKYEVLKSIDNVTISKIAEAFEQPGGGLQYELPLSVKELIQEGFLREIK